MLQRILSIGKKVGCPVGLHTFSIEDCDRRSKEGWQFIAVLSEQGFMTKEALRTAAALGISTGSEFAKY